MKTKWANEDQLLSAEKKKIMYETPYTNLMVTTKQKFKAET